MKSFIFVFVFILNVIFAYTETEPVIKIYLNDGSSKQYRTNEIADLSFFRTNLSYSMVIYQSYGNLKSDFDIRTVDSIVFENNKTIKIVQSGNAKSFIISEIDSIIFTINTCTEIQISDQIWMCKNLDVDHYRNGDPIPEVRDASQWINLKTGAWCYYNNSDSIGKIYGKLYNWYAVNDARGLAPEGWHVPCETEFTTLSDYLGGESVAGGKMKEIGTVNWIVPNTGATNESGFSSLPGGCRIWDDGSFSYIGNNSYYWTTTDSNTTFAWHRTMVYYSTNLLRSHIFKGYGYAVRCVKNK